MSKSRISNRLLLIGQAPSRTSDPEKPLESEPLVSKLCALFGCQWYLPSYFAMTERRNVLTRWPGKARKADLFPLADARLSAESIIPRLDGRTVLFIGHATAKAFEIVAPPLTWREYPSLIGSRSTFTAAILPHPSGVNRWWNDPKNRRMATRFMRKAWRACAG